MIKNFLHLKKKKRHIAQLSLSSSYTPPPPKAICAAPFR